MPDSDDPFLPPDATMLRPRPGAGRRTFVDPARPRAAAPSVGRCRADSRRGARAPRHRPEPAGAGGESAAAADGAAARRRSRRWTSPGLRRHALDEIRRFEEQARAVRRAERDRPGRALCAVRRPRRSGAVDALGRSERMGAAPAAGGAAPRGVGRREVLRDARPDLAGSGSPHRPDGAAVPRVSRSASPASTRCRSAGTSASPKSSRTSTARFAIIAARRESGAVAALARTRGPAQSADSLRAVVGRRRGGAGDPRDRVHGVLREPRHASPRRCTRSSRRSASRTFRRRATTAPVAGPDAQAAAGARGTARRAQRGGARQPDDGHAAGAGPVPVRQRDGQPGVPRDACSG